MTVGTRVLVPRVGAEPALGTVAAVYRERGCGCRSVVVRLDNGREWAGKASEVRPA